MSKIHLSTIPIAVLALAISSGTLHATNYLQIGTGSASTLTCSTAAGPVSGTIIVKPLSALTSSSAAITVASVAVAGLVITPTSNAAGSQVLSYGGNTSVSYTVSAPAGCAGLTSGANPAIKAYFSSTVSGSTNATDVFQSIVVTVTVGGQSPLVTATGSPLVSTTSVTVNCIQFGANYTPGPAVTVTVTSPATGGTPFTIGTPSPTGLVVGAATNGGVATSVAASSATFTVQAPSSCTSTPVTYQISLTSAPAPALTLSVTTAVVSGSSLVVGPTSPNLTLTCSTLTGPVSGVITVSPAYPLSSGNNVTVSATSSVLVITPPANQVLSNTVTSLNYSVSAPAGCATLSSGSNSATVSVSNGTTSTNYSVTVNVTVSPTSALSVSPSSVTVQCNKPSYTVGPAQTVSITSTAVLGTPFTLGTQSPNGDLTLGTLSSNTASLNAATFTVAVNSTYCNSSAVSGTKISIPINAASPGTGTTLTVTINVANASPLTAAPKNPSLTYVKGSGTAGKADVLITSTSTVTFSVDTPTLPVWITVDSTTGTASSTGTYLRFSSTSICDTLAPGSYSQAVWLKVAGYAEIPITVNLLITNAAGSLTISEGSVQPTIQWTLGQPMPTGYHVTPVSSDTPIPYTVSTTGIVQLLKSDSTALTYGMAYNFAVPIAVTFDSTKFASAQPGQTLSGSVILTWGPNNTQTVSTFNVTVMSPGATLSSISPGSIPLASSGQSFTLTLIGSGFVVSTDPTQETMVGIMSGGSLVFDGAINATVSTSTSIVAKISVASGDTLLPFASGGTVTLGVCNPSGGVCGPNSATGTASFFIGANPIIQVVTSASSFIQQSPGTAPNVAPYDMISLFGADFCSSAQTGCTSSTILVGTPDSVAFTYPLYLVQQGDSALAAASQHRVTVTFYKTSDHSMSAAAPLLFASNSQINLLVPSAVSGWGGSADIVVSYGITGALASSQPFTVTVVATDPGMFAFGQDGQGPGAILGTDWNLVAVGHEAALRSNAADSDTIHLYLTGLGAPNSSATTLAQGSGSAAYSHECLSLASYNGLPTPNLGTADGAILQSSLITPPLLAPCLTTAPVVQFGGVGGTVTYAGWVEDSVAGLYQIDVQLPATTHSGGFQRASGTQTGNTLTGPEVLPVKAQVGGNWTQDGVTVAVAPRLKLAPASNPTQYMTISATAGVQLPTDNSVKMTASDGSPAYTFAVTSGTLPAGLLLNAATPSVSVAGTPAANTSGTYIVTITATDSTSGTPLTGSLTFTIKVAGGLVLNSNPTNPSASTFNTPNATVAQIQATGGTWPYTYSLAGGSPVGLNIDSSSGIISTTAGLMAGTYAVTINAYDAAGLTGSLTGLSIPVVLNVTDPVGGGTDTLHVATGNSIQLFTTGNTGSVTYSCTSTYFTCSTGGLITLNGDQTSNEGNTYNLTVNALAGTPSGASAAGQGSIQLSITISN